MSEAQNNAVILNRKEWQTMMPTPITTAAGYFMVNDNANTHRLAMYMNLASTPYLYDHEQDDWLPIPASALAPAVAAGACGCFTDWSITFTANGGSTSTIQVAAATHNINGLVVGKVVEFKSGNNIGLLRTITKILTLGTGNIVLTFDSIVGTAVANNDTFMIASGSFWILTTGTLTTTSFKQFDIATMAWVAKAITGLPAWGTDARMTTPCIRGKSYESGTAAVTSAATYIDCTGKTWTADQWINYQVRITDGTGIGQIRVITDNDTDTLTFAAMSPAPDATSTFVIEGDEDAIYVTGNGAKLLYKYSIIGGTWATVTVNPARTNNTAAGMSLDFVGVTGDTGWADVTNIKDGRYLYSLDGATAVLNRYDIAIPGWTVVTYLPNMITTALGSGTDWSGKYIYISKEGSATVPQRIYKYDVVFNTLKAVTTDWYLGGAALIGNKIWVRELSSAGLVKWIYVLQSTSTVLRRIMIF